MVLHLWASQKTGGFTSLHYLLPTLHVFNKKIISKGSKQEQKKIHLANLEAIQGFSTAIWRPASQFMDSFLGYLLDSDCFSFGRCWKKPV